MQSDEQLKHKDKKPSRPRVNWEFYYFEQVGSRYYLRFTPFGLVFMILGLLISLAVIVLSDKWSGKQDANANITGSPAPIYSPNQTTTESPSPPVNRSTSHPAKNR
jgi:hypothetical protein